MPDNATPLWARRDDAPAPEAAITAVHAFLKQARAWGTDREIPKLLAALQASSSPEHAARLHQWTTWVAFVDHALQELEDGTLDDWFTPTES